MKSRNGFVSNSSSSSFIVAVPSSFVPTEQDFLDSLCYGEDTVELAKKAWKEFMEEGYMNSEDNEGFYMVQSICDNNNFRIEGIDCGPDGGDTISNIFHKKNNKYARLLELVGQQMKFEGATVTMADR